MQRVEAVERSEEAEGSKIAIKSTKKKGKSSGRQTKLPIGQNSLKHTKPSPFAEKIDPIIPAFNANPKKASATRTKKVKGAESSASSSMEPKAKGKAGKLGKRAKAIADGFFSDEESDEEEVPDLDSRLGARRHMEPEVKGHGESEVKDHGEPEDDEVKGHGETGADVSIDEFPSADPITIDDSGSESDFISAPKRPRVKTSAEPKKKMTAPARKKKAAAATSMGAKKKPVAAKVAITKVAVGIGSKSIIQAKDGKSQSTLKIFATRGKKRALEAVEEGSDMDVKAPPKKAKPPKVSGVKGSFSEAVFRPSFRNCPKMGQNENSGGGSHVSVCPQLLIRQAPRIACIDFTPFSIIPSSEIKVQGAVF